VKDISGGGPYSNGWDTHTGDDYPEDVEQGETMNNFEEEVFDTREQRDKRWEELMLVKPHVVRGTTSDTSIRWWVRYPRLVIES
jgi:hypothetical protein